MFTAEKFGLGEAGLVDAGDDQGEALLGVVVLVDAAVDDARVADEAEHLVLLDELLGEAGDLLRVDLLVLGDVLDRPAVDAAVVVHAVEVGLGHARDPREVDAGHVGGDATDLDRVAGRLLARAHAALTRLLDVAAAARRGRRARRAWSAPPPAAVVAASAAGSGRCAAAAVVAVDDAESSPHAANKSAPAAAMTSNDASCVPSRDGG